MSPIRKPRAFAATRWAALIGVSLLSTSCASTSPLWRTGSSQGIETVEAAPVQAAGKVVLDDSPEAVVTTHRAQSPLPPPPADYSQQQLLKTSAMRNSEFQARYTDQVIQQAGHDAVDLPPPIKTVQYNCEPREYVDTPGCPQDGMPCRTCPPSVGMAPNYTPVGAPNYPPEPLYYTDEYICDGGDEGYPVHYHGPDMQGLEAEDTVVEFSDNHGKRRVQPSNKVCIYAPRFAAVSSMSAPLAGTGIVKAAGAHDGQALAGLNAKMRIDEHRDVDQLEALRKRTRASALDKRQSDGVFDNTVSVEVHSKLINLFESIKFIGDREFSREERLAITDGMAAAGAWSRDLSPVISASDVTGQQVSQVAKVEAYTAVEDPRGPGQLRVVKLADKSVAEIGDTIEFTIRFDNLGGLELNDVVLIDNLTPRLEYVDGSATHTLDGELQVEDNGEGSSKLTFRLTGPLNGKTGGVLKFQCVVR